MRSFQMIGSVFAAMTAVIALVATACAAAGSDELPRYRLKVGQELKYQGKSDFKYDNGSLAYQNDWTFWVVRATTMEAGRVIGRSSSRTSQTMSGQKAHEMPADVTIAYFDLFPDGRVVANKTCVKDLLAKAETTLKDAKDSLTLPDLREQIDVQLKKHKQMESYYTEEAQNRSAVLGKPAADWETKDLEGKPHSLKGYKGKVVILDFWYRGCGWCIRAMPQMKELAEDFKGQPVAVLGMNTDSEEKDAKFVVDEMKLNYPVLKAEGLPEKYHVRGFPTLIIVDQTGKVADVHVGYSPTLREDVAKAVKRLLARQ